MMTAHGTPEVIKGALDLGVSRVVTKPFEVGDVTEWVRQATA
jgi:CheY-like chemotaxis protein